MKLTPQEFEALRAWIRAEAMHMAGELMGYDHISAEGALAMREAARELFVGNPTRFAQDGPAA